MRSPWTIAASEERLARYRTSGDSSPLRAMLEQTAESARRFGPRRRRRRRPMSSCVRSADRRRLSISTPKPALGNRRSSSASSISNARPNSRAAASHLTRSRRAPLACLVNFLPDARRERGYTRDRAAAAGVSAQDDVVDGTAHQVRRRDVRRPRRRPVHDSDGRSAAHRDARRRDPSLRRRSRCNTPPITPCFRKEAGAAGKDTRGLIRQHQFEKVELVWVTAPEGSLAALERLTGDAEELLHRSSSCRIGSSRSAAPTPVSMQPRPTTSRSGCRATTLSRISSCSNCTDFQARRAPIRFRREAKAKPEVAHTLNGSAWRSDARWSRFSRTFSARRNGYGAGGSAAVRRFRSDPGLRDVPDQL